MRVVIMLLGLLSLSACASVDSQVRTRAAKDFSCKQSETRILESDESVYRVAGCGEVATYQCSETPSLAMHCDRVRYQDDELREVTTASGKYSISRREQ